MPGRRDSRPGFEAGAGFSTWLQDFSADVQSREVYDPFSLKLTVNATTVLITTWCLGEFLSLSDISMSAHELNPVIHSS